MSDPTVTCTKCGHQRSVMKHADGRGFPPDKAKRWMLRNCPLNLYGKGPCKENGVLRYTASISPRVAQILRNSGAS